MQVHDEKTRKLLDFIDSTLQVNTLKIRLYEGEYEPFSFDDMDDCVTRHFTHYDQFNIKDHTHEEPPGLCEAYGNPDENIGCIRLMEGNEVTVLAFVDFNRSKQIIVERNPEGEGDRITAHMLIDAKLAAIQSLMHAKQDQPTTAAEVARQLTA